MTANAKKEWEKENLRTVSCRLRKDVAERFKKYAEYRGTSVHGVLAEYVNRCLELDGTIPAAEKASVKALQLRVDALEKKLAAANTALDQARNRALNAEALVDKWLRSADRK